MSGCLSLPIDTADTASLGATSGVAVWSRMADGAARADVVIRAGSFRADPGQDGVAIFTTVVPGRAPVRVVVDDEDATWGTVDIAPLQLHGIQLVAPELVPQTLEAVDGAGSLDLGGGSAVDFPSGSVVTAGQPFSGSVDLLTAQLGQVQERSLPGDFKALFEDARIEPVEIVEAVRVVAVGGSDVSLEAPATLTLALDTEAEAVASAASELFWVRFDSGQTYWKRVNQPVTLQAGAASGPITTLGWWALATPAERTRGCVVGRVETPAGAPLPGAEVAYQEADAFGHHRTWADGNGRFCAAPLLDRSSEAWVFAMERDDLRFRYSATTTLPTASVAGDCATQSTCVDAGTVVVSGLGAR